jgi:hydrogenase maturation protease
MPAVRVLSRQQWTPDLAEDVAHAESVVFIDCSVESLPGEVNVHPVEPAAAGLGFASHHVGATELLALSKELYDSLPRKAVLLTVGVGSTDLGETFSAPITEALPGACRLLDQTIAALLESSQR